MLKQLKYKVKIKVPARTLEANITFEDGLTAITGKNGNGKSMTLEMVQYALFGTEALRGKADDYESIEVELDYLLNAKVLRVNRSKSKATLRQLEDDSIKDLASGTKSVNAKIQELFGYSADVFRVANVCNQGKIEELGNMKPTERKRLVDETVGLDVLDDLMVFIDGKRKDLGVGIKAIEGFLVEPKEPQKALEADHGSDFYKGVRDNAAASIKQRDRLGMVANRTLVEVAAPEAHADADKLEEYQGVVQHRAELLTQYTVLSGELKAIPMYAGVLVTTLHEKDAELDTLMSQQRTAQALQMKIEAGENLLRLNSFTQPVMTWEDIKFTEGRNLALKRWQEKQAIKAKNVPHDCPNCQYHWEDEDPRLKTEYADVPDETPEHTMSVSQLQKEIKNREAYERAAPIVVELEGLRREAMQYSIPLLTKEIEEIQTYRKKFADSQVERDNAKRRHNLQTRLAVLGEEFAALKDHAEDIKRLQAYNSAMLQYKVQKKRYDADLEEKNKAQEQLKAYAPDLDEVFSRNEQYYILTLNYETNMVNYVKAKESYDKAREQLEVLKAELEDWTNARQAVVDLRVKVKGYLLPSLNTVASILIQQMTGGDLTLVNVDDSFEITVDGQRLETLSGAGKAVANLALRLGLGSVLTNRVFSVVMLDEIDASMDDDRAGYVAQCLKNLTKTIKQVIQVSHKTGLVADHYVRM